MDQHEASYQELKTRLKFLGIDESTTKALVGARDLLAAALPGAVDRFYERMAGWDGLMKMFSDPSRRKYARDAQINHWLTLFNGQFDQEYLNSAAKIGLTHSRIGLEPRWFLGAYSQILGDLQQVVLKQPKADHGPLIRALTQVTVLDMDLVISVYLAENKDRQTQNLAALSDKFRTSVSRSISEAGKALRTAAQKILDSSTESVRRGEEVDAAARNASFSVQSMASAMEELSRSVLEIRHQTSRSTEVTALGVARTKDIDKVMASLSDAVRRITESVQLINDIAERTNILAINASIEAARAGIVGRGFAVVASEVRTLAAQTVQATESISGQISALRESSEKTVGAVKAIVGVIQEIDRHTASIASAVDEQGTVTQDVARNAQTAAEGAGVVSENIALVSKAVRETGTVAHGLEEVLAAMDEDFRSLNRQVDVFLAEID